VPTARNGQRSLWGADELTHAHTQAARRAEREIDPRAHAAGNPVRTAIIDPDRAAMPVQWIRGRYRSAESVVVGGRGQGERAEALAARRASPGRIKRS
jgi:hypothetical protein